MFRRTAGAAIVVLCGLSLLAHSPAGASTPAGPAATQPPRTLAVPSDGEAAGFARQRGIELAEARQRLSWQVVAPDLAERLEVELGARYGGVWVDVHDGDRIKVAVVHGPDPETTEAVRRVATALGLTDGYDLVGARYSWATMMADNDWLGARIATVNTDATATLAAGLRTDLNAVELQTPPGGYADRRAAGAGGRGERPAGGPAGARVVRRAAGDPGLRVPVL